MRIYLPVLAAAASLLSAFAASSADLDDADLDRRIDQLRCSDFAVTLVDELGKPIVGKVEYELRRNDFNFGTCIYEDQFAENPDMPAQRYLATLEKYFNSAVHERALKWRAMEPVQGMHDDKAALRQWQWCHDHGLTMRGHSIFWGLDKVVQPWVKSLTRAELETAMKDRAKYVLTLFKGKIQEYDVNNEMLRGDYYGKTLGLATGAPYFKWCKEADPGAVLCVNEYNILAGNQVDRYVAHIKALLADGAPLGGIGDQGQFYSPVPDGAKLWAVLDKLAQFKLPVTVTEFGIHTSDEKRQASDLTRFYRLCFAHPAVHGIYMWGFWEGQIYTPESALWRNDWTPKPAGEAYIDLVSRKWRTAGEQQTDSSGAMKFRGFNGTYVFRVNGRAYTGHLGHNDKAIRLGSDEAQR